MTPGAINAGKGHPDEMQSVGRSAVRLAAACTRLWLNPVKVADTVMMTNGTAHHDQQMKPRPSPAARKTGGYDPDDHQWHRTGREIHQPSLSALPGKLWVRPMAASVPKTIASKMSPPGATMMPILQRASEPWRRRKKCQAPATQRRPFAAGTPRRPPELNDSGTITSTGKWIRNTGRSAERAR